MSIFVRSGSTVCSRLWLGVRVSASGAVGILSCRLIPYQSEKKVYTVYVFY